MNTTEAQLPMDAGTILQNIQQRQPELFSFYKFTQNDNRTSISYIDSGLELVDITDLLSEPILDPTNTVSNYLLHQYEKKLILVHSDIPIFHSLAPQNTKPLMSGINQQAGLLQINEKTVGCCVLDVYLNPLPEEVSTTDMYYADREIIASNPNTVPYFLGEKRKPEITPYFLEARVTPLVAQLLEESIADYHNK